jgi:hypothetical protein
MKPIATACLALLLGLASLYGQAPGVKSKPPKRLTKEEKLKTQKDAYKDTTRVPVPDGPGEVDKRVKAFKERMKLKAENAGEWTTKSGRRYVMAFGETTIPAEYKPGWVQRRILAFGEAELAARAEMALFIERLIRSEQLFKQFGGTPAGVIDRFAQMKKAAADKEDPKSEALYSEATAEFASAQVVGAITIKTIEGESAGEYKIVRVMVWSPQLRDLAVNALADAEYFLPLEKVKEDELDEIPTAEADLVKEVGVKVYFNKLGQRYYVAYGQAEPLITNPKRVGRALQIAKKRAELHALGQLARTLAATVTAGASDQQKVVEATGDKDSAGKKTVAFYQAMESESGKIRISGAMPVRAWQHTHPAWKLPVVGCVVVWSPGTRDLVKDLGLDSPIDVHSPEKLLDLLAKKYGKAPGKPSGGRAGKGEVTESKDPRRDP